MTPRKTTWQVVFFLLILGTACLGARIVYRHEPLLPVWRLTYTAEFHARQSGAQILIAVPENTRHVQVFHSNVVNTDLQEVRYRASRANARHDIALRAPQPGQYKCETQFDVHVSPHGNLSPDQQEYQAPIGDRERYLDKEKGIPIEHAAVQETLERLREGQTSREDIVERIFYHCLTEIVAGGDAAPQDAAEALSKGTASSLGRARAMVALCRASKIPARLVTGFEIIKLGNDIHPHTWVEVFIDKRWQPYDPENGFTPGEIPYYFMPVRHLSPDLVRVNDATDLVTKYSIIKLPTPAGAEEVQRRRRLLDIFDLTQLPLNLHEPMSLILLLPLGALVTAFVRTIIGIRTFGTFTPTLLALAFIYNDWRTGVFIFVLVMILGFTSRTFLDRLKLLLVPRLGIIMTLVVLLMVFSVSVISYSNRAPSGATVLLPMVILTNLVEKFFVTTEEDNFAFAVQLLITTLIMAFIIYLLLGWKSIGSLLLAYPELHCFTVVILILMGRYTGYRWTELLRFRDVSRFEQPSKE